MSTTLTPLITNSGLQAVFAANNAGLQAEITHIAIGDQAYTPSQSATALANERARLPIADAVRVNGTQIHLTALADGPDAYWVREVGFILSDGTLLAVWSDPSQALAYKSGTVDLLLAFDLVLSALPADSVVVQGTGSLNLILTEELAAMATGQIELLRTHAALQDRVRATEESAATARRGVDYLLEQMPDRAELDAKLLAHSQGNAESLAGVAIGQIALIRRNLALFEQSETTGGGRKVSIGGDRMVGPLELARDPVLQMEAVPLRFLETQISTHTHSAAQITDLPSPSGQGGRYLGSDGAAYAWGDPATDAILFALTFGA